MGDYAEEYVLKMTKRRWGRVVMYLGLVFSGVFALSFPSQLVADQVSHAVSVSWGGFMVIGAGLCLFGAATDRWIGEYSGIPLLASSVAMYGGSALVSAKDLESYPLLAYGLVLISFAAGLVARWRDVQDIKTHAEELGREDKREG